MSGWLFLFLVLFKQRMNRIVFLKVENLPPMKRISFLLFTLCLFTLVNAQQSAYLDIANVKALIHSNGLLFVDTNYRDSDLDYEVPKGSGLATINSAGFWMSSSDIRNGLEHIAISYDKYGLDSLIKTGPVDLVNQKADTSSRFQRLWKVNQTTIDSHIVYWNNTNYKVPASILDWPGNGNSNTAKILAPFQDLDGDSIYEPLDGEYPLIEGDQAIYVIANDYHLSFQDTVYHYSQKIEDGRLVYYDSVAVSTLSGTRIEMHLMLYAYRHQKAAIKNTVFMKVKLFNRSNSSFFDHQDFRVSLHTDFDIGYFQDDYFGTDTLRNMVYAYNADDYDETRVYPSITFPGYGSNLPAQGLKFLDSPIKHSMTEFDILTITDRGEAEYLGHHYYLQRNRWNNGRPLYHGGDGYVECVDTLKEAKFYFDGDPTIVGDSLQWTKINPCPTDTAFDNHPFDEALIAGPAVPSQFKHGSSIEFNCAFVFAQTKGGSISSVVALQKTADTVQHFFDSIRVTSLVEREVSRVDFNLYPNPTQGNVILELEEKDFEVRLFNLQGVQLYYARNEKELSLNDMATGIYFVRVESKKGFGMKKLMVTH